MNQNQKDLLKFLSITALIVIISMGGFALFTMWSFTGTYTVAKVDCGRGRYFLLTGSTDEDHLRDVIYQVYEKDTPLMKYRDIIGYSNIEDSKKLRFSSVTSPSGNLTILTEETHPNVVTALYDFQSGETWPAKRDNRLSKEQHRSIIVSILEQLNKELNTEFTLDGAPEILGKRN